MQTKTNIPRPPSPAPALLKSMSRACALLNEITDLLHDRPAPDSPDLNWNHVGDVNHVVLELEEIRNFLKPRKE